MVILMGIILLHLLVILSARTLKEKGLLENAVIVILTLLLVAWVAFGMYTMEMPEIKEGF